jgi:hypothetical protein
MKHRSLLALKGYSFDRDSYRSWRRGFLSIAIACIAFILASVVFFTIHLAAFSIACFCLFLVLAAFAVILPLKSIPVSLLSKLPMDRYRNSDSSEFEILYVDEVSKSYFTHTFFYFTDVDAKRH